MANYSEIIEELNDIIEKTYDSVKGYEKASEKVSDASLVNFFNRRINERQTFITELQNEVRSLGGTPDTHGSTTGSLHRAWIDFKTALSFDKDEAVLEACITGEKNCLGEYDDLLEESGLPDSTRQMLSRQRNAVQAALDQVKAKEEFRD